jgi:hypothetical protein
MFWILLLVQNVILPLLLAYGVLKMDQYWHGKQEFNRAYARAVSLGVDSRKHPEKVTLEALFMASEAELEYATENIGRDVNQIFKELEEEISDELMEHVFRGRSKSSGA